MGTAIFNSPTSLFSGQVIYSSTLGQGLMPGTTGWMLNGGAPVIYTYNSAADVYSYYSAMDIQPKYIDNYTGGEGTTSLNTVIQEPDNKQIHHPIFMSSYSAGNSRDPVEATRTRGKSFRASDIDVEMLSNMWESYERIADTKKNLYLVGKRHYYSGTISSLRLVEITKDLDGSSFQIEIDRLGKNYVVKSSRGSGNFFILESLYWNERITFVDKVREKFISDYAAGEARGNMLHVSKIGTLMLENMWKRYEKASGVINGRLYIIGMMESSGKISALRPVTKISNLGRNYFIIELAKFDGRILVVSARGRGALRLLMTLSSNGQPLALHSKLTGGS